MSKVYELDYSYKNLLKLYNKRISSGDFEGALLTVDTMLNNEAKKVAVFELYAKTYYKLCDYDRAVDYWFLYLSVCKASDYAKAYNALGACFYKLNEKHLAGYYFNEQLGLSKSPNFEYNSVGAEFFDEIMDNSDKYYIAYPYDKADFTKLLEKSSMLMKAGLLNEALNELEIIPSNSKYYVDALIQKSLCEYMLGNVEKSLFYIDEAVKVSPNNLVALCNGISLFSSVNNTEKVNEFLSLFLKNNDTFDSDDLIKIIMVFCELKDYKNAEIYSEKYLKENKYSILILHLAGITKYNLQKFNESVELFSKLYRLTKSYVYKYYLELSKTAIKKVENNKKVSKINYTFDVLEKEKARLNKRSEFFLNNKGILTSKFDSEVREILDYVYNSPNLSMQLSFLQLLFLVNNELSMELCLKYIVQTGTFDRVKIIIVDRLIYNGYCGNLKVVFGKIFKSVKIKKTEFIEGLENLNRAYSLCVSKLVPLEKDLSVIADVAERLQVVFLDYDVENKLNDANSLSALIFELSEIQPIKSRREFIKFFGANAKTLKKYKELAIKGGFYFSDDELYSQNWLIDEDENNKNNK